SLANGMQAHATQQAALLDDSWAILGDLSLLLKRNRESFSELEQQHGHDWAVAHLIQQISRDDRQLREQLPKLTRYTELQETQDHRWQRTSRHEKDTRHLALLWTTWFETLG